jgi:hypothetical protein
MKIFLSFSDSNWNVTGGGEYGFICNATSESTGNDVICKNLNIPMCVDRTVYCTYPPESNVVIKTNPSPAYKNSAGIKIITFQSNANYINTVEAA